MDALPADTYSKIQPGVRVHLCMGQVSLVGQVISENHPNGILVGRAGYTAAWLPSDILNRSCRLQPLKFAPGQKKLIFAHIFIKTPVLG